MTIKYRALSKNATGSDKKKFNMLKQKNSSFTRNSKARKRELLEMFKSMKKKAVVPSASQPIFS